MHANSTVGKTTHSALRLHGILCLMSNTNIDKQTHTHTHTAVAIVTTKKKTQATAYFCVTSIFSVNVLSSETKPSTTFQYNSEMCGLGESTTSPYKYRVQATFTTPH